MKNEILEARKIVQLTPTPIFKALHLIGILISSSPLESMPKFLKVQFQQNLMSRFQENFKNIGFGIKNVPFILFYLQEELSSKKWDLSLCVY